MTGTQYRSINVHEQVLTLGTQAGKIRADLMQGKLKVPPASLEALQHLEATLVRVGQRIEAFETEHNNMIALAEVGEAVNSTLELEEVLRVVMDNIVRLTRAERGFLMLREPDGQMATRMARNWGMESINDSEMNISRTVVQRVIDSGEPIITTNAQEDSRFAGQQSIVAFNLRSILCVPLKVKNVLTGVLYADNRIRTGIFKDTERDLLLAFANQAAAAIENARLFTSLRQTLAEVTGLKSLMDNVFASITSGVITANVQDQITLCNRAAGVILGEASNDILGRGLDEILGGISGELRPRLNDVLQTDKPLVDLEVTHPSAERGVQDWRLNLSPLKDAQNTTQGIAIVLDDLTERKKLEAQRRLFERMVSPAVISQLNPDSLQLGGKRMEITSLFGDVRGFTTFSEGLEPEKLVAILNRYLAAMADAVLSQQGTIDKFMGDAIMAWFNAPIPQPDHTLRAVRTALAIRRSVEALYAELPQAAHLAFGIGIHCGEAVLGLIGTEKRLEYTAIGDSVNTSKRIQENSAPNQILLSKDAYETVKNDVEAKPLGSRNVKGKAQPLELFELINLK
jgi:PAS domain S-box-containing protein